MAGMITCHLCNQQIEQTDDMEHDMERTLLHISDKHPDQGVKVERWPDGGLVYTEEFDPKFPDG